MNVLKFSQNNHEPYSEIGQSNKLRWMNIKPIEGGYESVSQWWKCKDFMNDAITAKHTGNTYSIYGFTCDPAVFWAPKQKDMYLLLKNVADGWFHNIEVVNKKVVSMRFKPITYEKVVVEEENLVFSTIPEKYLLNTLNMSTITLWIRMANTTQPYDTMAGMIADGANLGDQGNYEATLKKPMNKLPKEFKDYVWHSGNHQGCLRDGSSGKFPTSMMHNCGVVSWSWKEKTTEEKV